MKFICTCEPARLDEVRRRLTITPIRHSFYMKLWNRPTFEFDDEADMIAAVLATNAHLAIQVHLAPPKSGKGVRLALAGHPPRRTPPDKIPARRMMP